MWRGAAVVVLVGAPRVGQEGPACHLPRRRSPWRVPLAASPRTAAGRHQHAAGALPLARVLAVAAQHRGRGERPALPGERGAARCGWAGASSTRGRPGKASRRLVFSHTAPGQLLRSATQPRDCRKLESAQRRHAAAARHAQHARAHAACLLASFLFGCWGLWGVRVSVLAPAPAPVGECVRSWSQGPRRRPSAACVCCVRRAWTRSPRLHPRPS